MHVVISEERAGEIVSIEPATSAIEEKKRLMNIPRQWARLRDTTKTTNAN